MALEEKLKQIDREIRKKEFGKARDRLHGLLVTYPNELKIREKLGEVYYKLHQPEMAGRYWLLSKNRLKEKQALAVLDFLNSCHHDGYTIFRQIKFKGDVDQLDDEYARQILFDLQTDIQEATGIVVNLKRGGDNRDFYEELDELPWYRLWLNRIGCFSALALLLTIFVVGLVSSVRWMIGMF